MAEVYSLLRAILAVVFLAVVCLAAFMEDDLNAPLKNTVIHVVSLKHTSCRVLYPRV